MQIKNESTQQKIQQTVELDRRAFPLATRECFTCLSTSSLIIDVMKAAKYDARVDNLNYLHLLQLFLHYQMLYSTIIGSFTLEFI